MMGPLIRTRTALLEPPTTKLVLYECTDAQDQDDHDDQIHVLRSFSKGLSSRLSPGQRPQ